MLIGNDYTIISTSEKWETRMQGTPAEDLITIHVQVRPEYRDKLWAEAISVEKDPVDQMIRYLRGLGIEATMDSPTVFSIYNEHLDYWCYDREIVPDLKGEVPDLSTFLDDPDDWEMIGDRSLSSHGSDMLRFRDFYCTYTYARIEDEVAA